MGASSGGEALEPLACIAILCISLAISGRLISPVHPPATEGMLKIASISA
jgi:hypothetical protein